MTFHPGQVVLLRSGGPAMTVEHVSGGVELVGVVWFDGAECKRDAFLPSMLLAVGRVQAEFADLEDRVGRLERAGIEAVREQDRIEATRAANHYGVEEVAAFTGSAVPTQPPANNYDPQAPVEINWDAIKPAASAMTEEEHQEAADAAPYGECYVLPNGDCIGRGCPHDVGTMPTLPIVVEDEPTLSDIGKNDGQAFLDIEAEKGDRP